MKPSRLLFCLLFVLLCFFPLFLIVPGGSRTVPAPASTPVPFSLSPPQPTDAPLPALEDIQLWDSAAQSPLTLSARDYLIGAAACEVPPSWPDDAILAQMVACHSWALYQRDHGSAPEGGWFTVNTAQCSGCTTPEVLRSRWGTDFQQNYDRFSQLAAQVERQVLCYDGAPAAAFYHSVSSGHTESSKAVWGEALPYLQGVDSSWDAYSEHYQVTVQYTRAQMLDALAMNLKLTPGTGPYEDPAAWFGAAQWDDAGYVSSMTVCGQPFSGTELRSALGLRSACFSVSYADGMFSVTTKGYGHGVGLSQYGALAMAQGGTGWEKILAYYFPGTQLRQL